MNGSAAIADRGYRSGGSGDLAEPFNSWPLEENSDEFQLSDFAQLLRIEDDAVPVSDSAVTFFDVNSSLIHR